MLILSILVSLFAPQHQLLKNKVTVDFEFQSMKLGRPTLAYYNYNVHLKNNTNQAIYIILPNWFNEKLNLTDKVWGAELSQFETSNGFVIYGAESSSVTIFKLKSKEKRIIKGFQMQTFDETIQEKLSTGIQIISCSAINVGELSLEDFMEKKDAYNKELPFQPKNVETIDITIKTVK